MKRFLSGLGVVAALLMVCAGSAAEGDVPAGPRLAFTRFSAKPLRLELLSVDSSGAGLQRIAAGSKSAAFRGPTPFFGPTWSPDGNLIAFGGYVGSSKRRIFIAAPDGSGFKAIPGTSGALDPVFAPDGHSLAFARTRTRAHLDPNDPLDFYFYSSTTTWVLDIDTGVARRLTRWSNGLTNEPSSFSPDGSTLALSRDGLRGQAAVALNLGDGSVSVLVRDAAQPVFSPDGTRIAFVSYRNRNGTRGFDPSVPASELYVMRLDGGGLTRVTHTADEEEQSPSWDPSGERIAYTQTTRSEALSLGLTNVVMEVNADGTCARRVFGGSVKKGSQAAAGLYGPAWQPGPGREAGPLSC